MKIKKVHFQNLLSFGPDFEFELRDLNVLIGPNGSGKSNLLHGLSLFKASNEDITKPFRDSGSFDDWISKTTDRKFLRIEASIYDSQNSLLLCHKLPIFGENKISIGDEVLLLVRNNIDTYLINSGFGYTTINKYNSRSDIFTEETIDLLPFEAKKSIVSQLNDVSSYHYNNLVTKFYRNISIFNDWGNGSLKDTRKPQSADGFAKFLNESYDNLTPVLNNLQFDIETKKKLKKYIQLVNDNFEDISILSNFGQIQTYIEEKHLKSYVPASRLSDGTLRFLCLLAILLHPKPPSLICIEEPEVGLHPDMMGVIKDLLVDAATRTQVIVTTHSSQLVSQFSEEPESIVVVEKHNGVSQFERLDKENLSAWLEKYSLGELWTRGHLGGNRW